MKTTSLALFTATCLLMATPLQAATLAPLNVETKYRMHWNGVPFGKLSVNIAQGKGTRMNSHIESTGLLKLFSQHESDTTLEAASLSPARGARTYETFYKTKKKPRHVKLVYDAKGAVTEEVVEPPEDYTKRPRVSAAQKARAVDPLTFVLDIREQVFDALQAGGKSFSVRVYEGRRLMDTHFTLLGQEKLTLGGKTYNTIKVSFKRAPITGFTEKELREIANGEPPVIIYFSDDAHFLPLRVQADALLGSLKTDLKMICDTPCTK